MKTLSVIFNKAPYGSQSGRELLDIALMAAAFDMSINAIFMEDGVYQLLNNQQPEIVNIKNHSVTFKALELYGIETVVAVTEDIQSRNLTAEQLLPIYQQVNTDDTTQLLSQSDFVFML